MSIVYPKVSIIILNWNGLKDTVECLESLKKIFYPNYEVVVVDNGSRENEADVLEKKFGSYLRIVRNRENLGFAGGSNVGIRQALAAGASFVLLLNNDTVVGEKVLDHLVAAADSDAAIGLAGPKIYFYADRSRIWSAGGKTNYLMTKGEMVGYNEIDRGQYDRVEERDFMTGCCLLVKRSVIEEIGLLPEDYFLYFEDTDWCLAARKKGWKCVYVPTAEIWHKASVGLGEGSPAYIYYNIRNGLFMAKKNGSPLIVALVYLDSVWRIFKQIPKYIFRPAQRVWAKFILVGIWDFYLGKTGRRAEF